MKLRGTIKNVLAALGAVFAAIIVISIVAALFGGRAGVTGDKVAVVKLEGVITDTDDILAEFKSVAEREDVKAVVLRIDSPGGAVGPSQEIHREVTRLRETKKVVASMGAIAASGGYYAASAAERIVANPGTITGSIGVVVEFVNAEELLSKIGLKGYVVKSGRFKDTGSPFRGMEKDERELVQAVIDDVNAQFIDAVASGRNLPREKVAAIADGRILTGSQALKNGLVDELGSLEDAINLGARLAGIEGKPRVIYTGRKVFRFWKTALQEAIGGALASLASAEMRIMYLAPNTVK